jgi:hypothetical protein
VFLALHSKYLGSDGDLRRRFDATVRELRRALGGDGPQKLDRYA